MKRKLAQSISLILCLLLVSSLLACGTSGTTDPEKQTATSGTTTETFAYKGSAPIAAEKVTLSILTSNGASRILGFADMTWWQEVLKRANVKLEMEEIDISSYNDVLKPRLAAAVDLPDIVFLNSKDNDMANIKSGTFIDLTGYYDSHGINLAKQFAANPGLKAELTTPDGKIYYVPYIYTTANNSRCLMMNAGYLDKLGLKDKVKTTDDFYNYLTAVKREDANGNGDTADEIPLFSRAGMIQLWSMYWGLDLTDTGGFQADDKGKVTCGYASDRYLEFLTYMNRLYKEGLLYSEFATANLDTQMALFSKNQIGSMIHFVSNCSGYSQAINPSWNIDKDAPIIVPAVPLTGPHGDQYVYGRDALGTVFGITKTCKDPAAAFSFMDYLFSEEVGILTWFGIEGTDYNVVNGQKVFTDLFKQNKDDYQSKSGYNFGGLPSYQYPEGYMAKQCQAVRDISNNVLSKYVMNPSVPFAYKLDAENEILQAYLADLQTFFSENLIAFITGTRPLNEWDAYLKALENMHLADVIKVYQASADRAAAAK